MYSCLVPHDEASLSGRLQVRAGVLYGSGQAGQEPTGSVTSPKNKLQESEVTTSTDTINTMQHNTADQSVQRSFSVRAVQVGY